VSRGAGTPAESTSRSFGAARPANARGELIRSCTVRSWRRRIRLCGRFPYRPTIGGACGMYRPPIGPVSAIERAIVCMQCPDLADLRQPISRGFLHTATSGAAPGFFLRAGLFPCVAPSTVSARRPPTRRQGPPTTHLHKRRLNTSGSASRSERSVLRAAGNGRPFTIAEAAPLIGSRPF
jgi:hypothetical protein